MRLAWFRPATHVSERLDDTAALVGALGSEHEIAVIDEARAHDFVRLDFRTPFDLCIYELANTRQHAFVWPYLLHVPGLLRLRSFSLHDSRTEALQRQHRERDRALELAFGGRDLITAPVIASRMTVVSDAHAAARLQRAFPATQVRHAPIGIGKSQGPGRVNDQRLIVGLLEFSRGGLVPRAFGRAGAAGARLEMMVGPPDAILDEADVLIAMSWPPPGEPTMALAGMAAGRPVIVLETESTAGWPALDPQTWQPRGWTGQPPIVVSIDPRDEEHSLALALRRLATDAQLRESLGAAAHEWWRQHATVDHAVQAWRSILAEAITATPPPRPSNWPRHLTANGTERARELLAEFGATVDFLT
jgi:hypothetical protein